MDVATVDRLLTTTRTVRRRLDLTRAVPEAVIEACVEIALQAPTAGNRHLSHFVIVTDPAKKAAIADVYRRARSAYHARPPSFYNAQRRPSSDEAIRRMRASGDHLAARMQDVPVLILACIEGRVETRTAFEQATLYGSILPAAWSLMLALRARGLGAAWTTDHLLHAEEVATLLGIPTDVTQTALLAVAYFTGDDFRPAARPAAGDVLHWNGWREAEAPR
jgi:nitroreductase